VSRSSELKNARADLISRISLSGRIFAGNFSEEGFSDICFLKSIIGICENMISFP